MHRSKIEKLTDYIIGEAIASLLQNDAEISGATLAAHLKAMAANEVDIDRLQALKLALAEIREEFPSARPVVDSPLYGYSEHTVADNKKH